MPDEEFLQRCRKRMEYIDSLPKEIRELIHEHGLRVINSFLQSGVRKPSHIKNIITAVREGSAAYGNGTRGQRDTELLRKELAFRRPDLVIAPKEPDEEMIQASMATVSNSTEVMTKHEKHRRRLKAALATQEKLP